MFFRTLLFLLLTTSLWGAAFDPKKDGFAFANETAWSYGVDEKGHLQIGSREKPAQFSHHCFNMVRASMQFYQFARFEPEARRVSSEELRKRMRTLFRIPIWSGKKREPIIFPGYRNLMEFSRSQTRLIQEEIGPWLPTYFRVGNWRMAWPLNRLVQTRAAEAVYSKIQAGKVAALYLVKFPSMNHAVLIYSAKKTAGGDIHFLGYDPNYPRQATHLTYVAAIRGFHFEKRFYFPGGEVRALPIYTSPFR